MNYLKSSNLNTPFVFVDLIRPIRNPSNGSESTESVFANSPQVSGSSSEPTSSLFLRYAASLLVPFSPALLRFDGSGAIYHPMTAPTIENQNTISQSHSTSSSKTSTPNILQSPAHRKSKSAVKPIQYGVLSSHLAVKVGEYLHTESIDNQDQVVFAWNGQSFPIKLIDL
jgi:hypothetical protein